MKQEFDFRKIVTPLLEWYHGHARILPWRENTEPYRVWVSEIMLQQTRVEAVKPYFERFLEQLPTIQHLAQAPEQQLLKLWEGLGYYNRVRNLQKAAQIICTQYAGEFPTDYRQIKALPGIGDYTAGAVCSISFGQPVPAVDGNVLRVVSRLTMDDRDILLQSVKRDVAEKLGEVYPKQQSGAFTQALMELGATVCLPNGTPACSQCPLKELCLARAAGQQLSLPVKAKKQPRRREQKTVLLLWHQGRLAVHRRPAKGLLARLWEYPNIDGWLSPEEISIWLEQQGIAAGRIEHIKNSRHIFTHVEWEMQSYQVFCSMVEEQQPFLWVLPHQLESEIALPAAFQKNEPESLRIK